MFLYTLLLLIAVVVASTQIDNEYCAMYYREDHLAMLKNNYASALLTLKDRLVSFKEYKRNFNPCLHIFENERSFDLHKYITEYMKNNYPLKQTVDDYKYIYIPLAPQVVQMLYNNILIEIMKYGYYNNYGAYVRPSGVGSMMLLCEDRACPDDNATNAPVPIPNQPKPSESEPVKENKE